MDINAHQYTDHIQGVKVLLVGVIPPPLGGIAVHLKRVQAKLTAQGSTVLVWDVCKKQQGLSQISYYWRLIRFCFYEQPQVIIYHTLQLRSTPIELLVLLGMGKLFNSQILVVIHSARFIDRISWLCRKLTGLGLKHCKQIIIVSQQVKNLLQSKLSLPTQVVVESPFLLPNLADRDYILNKLTVELKQFLRQHHPVVTVAITRLDDWQGSDLYGTDLAIAAFKSFLLDYPDAGLLIVLGNRNGKSIVASSNIYVLCEWEQEMWPLIGKSELFIRPTRSDANAISVMEALYLNIPVIASDVCLRPAGTVLFKSGDAADLYQKMVQVWQAASALNPTWPQNKIDTPDL